LQIFSTEKREKCQAHVKGWKSTAVLKRTEVQLERKRRCG